ncbi:MAG: efflux RND transporter permease subunit, partial [Pseudomonadota bacterium]
MSQAELEKQTGMIAWFAKNSVAANLLMVFIIIIGFYTYNTIQRQMFPNVEINYITVSANYPGASPQEIEESILMKIEEALKDVTEIKEGVYRANRNGGSATLEIDPDVELTDVLDKVKLRVDGIATFPAAMEPVTINQIEFQQQVIEMTLSADLPLTELKPMAKRIEDELLQLNNVSLVDVSVPLDEIAIEIKPDMLRQYGLTINDVANTIRNYSANFSAGQLRTDSGIISVRIENQSYNGDEFRQLPVKVGAHGGKVLLRDIAEIKDEFTEGERYFKLNGKNAVFISVKATKEQNMVPVAESVKKFIELKNKDLPVGVELKSLVDMTYYLNGRLTMMKSNLLQGMFLVALMLFLFLRFKLAMWVTIGIPVCFLGAVMMMPVLGITINVTSLFAFIMVLGIVVDDAI